MNTTNSQVLYNKAKKIIPGATQLLSKRAERFLPEYWPSYYKMAHGCEVWDIDGNHYYDFATMGIGACALGYSDSDINKSVISALESGSMCTLNCPEELELAELLIHLHPWAEMVRYTRTGGEACSVAVRIARAATNRSKVAFCGYHGWHDWYISSNLENSHNLDDQLLTNMSTLGVPKELVGTAIPFKYNDPNSIKTVFDLYGDEIACIIFEVQRGEVPNKNFLNTIQMLAKKHGALIVCDEVTSGFRMNVGGIHLCHEFIPDIAVFGKTIANGIAMGAVIGKRSVMNYAEESFISSAFWTEKLGTVAAIATIKKMLDVNLPKHLMNYGNKINSCWNRNAVKHGLKIKISGIPPLTHLSFDYDNCEEIQTYYTQIMIEKGFLVGPSVYSTYAYTDEILDMFDENTDYAFKKIRESINADYIPLISSIPRSDAFRRLVY